MICNFTFSKSNRFFFLSIPGCGFDTIHKCVETLYLTVLDAREARVGYFVKTLRFCSRKFVLFVKFIILVLHTFLKIKY